MRFGYGPHPAQGSQPNRKHQSHARQGVTRYFALPNGIPSHDTFGPVFADLDARQFQEHFVRWVQAIWPAELGEVISIDGKTVCGSHDRGSGKDASHMVSAWAHQSRLLLAQTTVDAKSADQSPGTVV